MVNEGRGETKGGVGEEADGGADEGEEGEGGWAEVAVDEGGDGEPGGEFGEGGEVGAGNVAARGGGHGGGMTNDELPNDEKMAKYLMTKKREIIWRGGIRGSGRVCLGCGGGGSR
jgi:hypothetical protein